MTTWRSAPNARGAPATSPVTPDCRSIAGHPEAGTCLRCLTSESTVIDTVIDTVISSEPNSERPTPRDPPRGDTQRGRKSMTITIRNTYGTPHDVSQTNPAHVTGCDRYRLPLVGTIAPGNPGYEDMIEILKDNGHHTRPEGYGLILLESEEFSATYFGSIEQIEQYKRDNVNGTATFDGSQGVVYARWPQGQGWDDFLPRVFWNQRARGAIADGVGIVTAFEHAAIPGAEVIVYEYEGKWLLDTDSATTDPVKMVTYHCTGCHKDTHHDSGHVRENQGPDSRRWTARQARQHIISAHRYGVGAADSECRPRDGEMLRVVNAVAKDKLGLSSNPLPDTDDAYCATKGPCSIIRALRVGSRPAVYRA